jgi:hypothetical protein
MKALRIFLLSALVAGSLIALRPAPARAADYWDGYWGWYDGTYRPYYQRYYSYGPAYSGPAYSSYPPSYGYYGGPGYYNYGYAPYAPLGGAYYGGAYYGLPGAGVGVYPGGAAVRVGPARIGWR